MRHSTKSLEHRGQAGILLIEDDLKAAVPILLFIPSHQEQVQVRGLELGADGCIVKPFDFQELLARVHTLLRRGALNRAHATSPEDRIVVGDLVLRQKLEDDPTAPQYIETVRGYGHRLVNPHLRVPQGSS